jgi:hypothetical protein
MTQQERKTEWREEGEDGTRSSPVLVYSSQADYIISIPHQSYGSCTKTAQWSFITLFPHHRSVLARFRGACACARDQHT